MYLYTISQSTGASLQWKAWNEGAEVFTEYGQVGGKLQQQSFTAQPTNVGKANERNPEQQAAEEVEKLYIAQVKNKHYRYSLDEAFEMYNNCKVPRKVKNYKDHGHNMSDMLISSIKKDGTRLMSLNGVCYSKAGLPEEVKVKHLRNAIDALSGYSFDAEVYCHGMSLQRIRAAFTKPERTEKELQAQRNKFKREFGIEMPFNSNEDALKLELHVFDIPVTGVKFVDRAALMIELEEVVQQRGLSDVVKFVPRYITTSPEERLELRNDVVKQGYEGLVHYELDDMYKFGTRASTTQKDKPRYESEALCVGVEKCKNGDGKLLLKACDELYNVSFKCMMKVNRDDGVAYPRDYDTMLNMMGKWITFSYESLSDNSIPCKPVGERERNCNDAGEPVE